jgi:hypothetical protein
MGLPALAPALQNLQRSGHRADMTGIGVKHAPATERADDSFRLPTVVAGA